MGYEYSTILCTKGPAWQVLLYRESHAGSCFRRKRL